MKTLSATFYLLTRFYVQCRSFRCLSLTFSRSLAAIFHIGYIRIGLTLCYTPRWPFRLTQQLTLFKLRSSTPISGAMSWRTVQMEIRLGINFTSFYV